jgi:hypothetical protein
MNTINIINALLVFSFCNLTMIALVLLAVAAIKEDK